MAHAPLPATPHGDPAEALPPARPDSARDLDQTWQLHEHNAHIVTLDTRHGAGAILESAVRSARSALRATLIGPASRDRLAAVAEAQQVAGWLAFDADRQELSRHLSIDAVHTARRAGDRSAEHFALSQLAMQAIHLRRPDQALDICATVLADDLPPGVRTLFVMRRARALNQYGEHAKALDLIHETHSRHLQGAGPRDPAWAWWLDTAEITWHHAMIHADNGHWTRAIPLFEQAATGRIPGSRTALNDHAYLLHALARTRTWPEATTLLHTHILPAHSTITSPRITHLLTQTTHSLATPTAPPPSHALSHALTTTLGLAPAPPDPPARAVGRRPHSAHRRLPEEFPALVDHHDARRLHATEGGMSQQGRRP